MYMLLFATSVLPIGYLQLYLIIAESHITSLKLDDRLTKALNCFTSVYHSAVYTSHR